MSTLIIGLCGAALLFILAAGLVLVFGLLGVVNLAHGAFYMLGAYTGFQVAAFTGNFWVALISAPLITAGVGVVSERLALSRLYHREHYLQFLVTFGLILILTELTRMFWGVGYLRVEPPQSLAGVLTIGDLRISVYRLFVVGAGVITAVALFMALDRTLIGTLVRAASSNSAMVSCLGVDVARIRTLVFAVGSGLAGFAGVIAAPLVPLSLDMGVIIIIDCFIVVAIGGMGNIRGAIAGALLVGVTRAYGQQYIPQFIELITFGVLVATLLIKPQGIFSHRERQA